jgi:hypothetical protein
MLYDGEDIEIAYDYSRRRPLTTLDFGDTSAVCSDLTSVHFDTENSSTSTEKSVIATPESSLQSQSSGHDEEQ